MVFLWISRMPFSNTNSDLLSVCQLHCPKSHLKERLLLPNVFWGPSPSQAVVSKASLHSKQCHNTLSQQAVFAGTLLSTSAYLCSSHFILFKLGINLKAFTAAAFEQLHSLKGTASAVYCSGVLCTDSRLTKLSQANAVQAQGPG